MNAATADPEMDIANGEEPRKFLGQSVGFENELIGQSNLPHQPSARSAFRAWLIFPNRQVRLRRLGNPSRTGRLRSEYAVNGPVYARRKAGHSQTRARMHSPLVELRKGMMDGFAPRFAAVCSSRPESR